MGKVQAILHLNSQREGFGSGGGRKKSYIYPIFYGKQDWPRNSLRRVIKKKKIK
jgi:hypothetical protein